MNKTPLTNGTFPVHNFEQVKAKVLSWANRFGTFCFLDNHNYLIKPHSEECLLAAGVKRELKANAGAALMQLQAFIDQKKSWLFGHIGYDLKNETENISSSHPDRIQFPDLYFFEPETLIRLNKNNMIIEAEEPEKIFAAIDQQEQTPASAGEDITIQNRISKQEYVRIINQLKQHILRGDCYEINFCQEFFANDVSIDPLAVYKKLSLVSPNPFSALYKLHDKWLICASPERFLKKQGHHILSQPIKGTAKRVTENPEKDEYSKDQLLHSPKDRSENVMVVDLVRNDLARVCEEGTVKVDELYGIYSFPQVHQLISTVSGKLKENISFTQIIKAAFPMGSMTGAPKKRVMELIEQYEKTARGIFSGAVGYISPDADFDFNVVIRSILFNASSRYLSFLTGSGITFYSDAEKEWEECLWKAEAIKKVLKEK